MKRATGKPRHKVSGQPDQAYRAWIRKQPCTVEHIVGMHDDVEAAHVKSRGAGGADMDNLVPLCRRHHAEQHQIGIRSFAARYGLDLRSLARAYGDRYREGR